MPCDERTSSSKTLYLPSGMNFCSAPRSLLSELFIIRQVPDLSKTTRPNGIWWMTRSRNLLDECSAWKRPVCPADTARAEATASRKGPDEGEGSQVLNP